MYCLAGVGGRVPDILANIPLAQKILVIAGCAAECAREYSAPVWFQQFRASATEIIGLGESGERGVFRSHPDGSGQGESDSGGIKRPSPIAFIGITLLTLAAFSSMKRGSPCKAGSSGGACCPLMQSLTQAPIGTWTNAPVAVVSPNQQPATNHL